MTPRHKQLGRSGPTCTGIFPASVWGVILNKLEKVGGESETEAGLSIINASIQLQKTFKKEKDLLALKKVIHFLFYTERIDFRDLLNLRLVSKSWNRLIHAQINETKQVALFEAYNPDKHGPEMDLRRLKMDRELGFIHCYPYWDYFVGFRLKKTVDPDGEYDDDHPSKLEMDLGLLKKKTKKKKKAPPKPNFSPVETVPLLALSGVFTLLHPIYGTGSAAVDLTVLEWEYDNCYPHQPENDVAEEISSFYDRLRSVFQLVGTYVWSLTFKFSFDKIKKLDDSNFDGSNEICLGLWNGFLELLAKLENLKHLTIDGRGTKFDHQGRGSDRNFEYPELPSLESIEVEGSDESVDEVLLAPFISHYSNKLRRLCLTAPAPSFIYTEISPEGFEKLTELEIIYCGHISDRHPEGTLRKLLDNLDSQLVRLKLQFGDDYQSDLPSDRQLSEVEVTLETEVFHWLERFPKLQSLEVISGRVSFSEKETWKRTEFPNLKYLKMEDGNGGLTFQFLRRLPGLQYFHLVTSPFPSVWDDSVEHGNRIHFKKELEEDVMYDSNVWEVLPKLQKITVDPVFGNVLPSNFTRDWYEHWKRRGESLARRVREGELEVYDNEDVLYHLQFREDIKEWLLACKVITEWENSKDLINLPDFGSSDSDSDSTY